MIVSEFICSPNGFTGSCGRRYFLVSLFLVHFTKSTLIVIKGW